MNCSICLPSKDEPLQDWRVKWKWNRPMPKSCFGRLEKEMVDEIEKKCKEFV